MKQRREMIRVGHKVGHDSLGGMTRNKGLRKSFPGQGTRRAKVLRLGVGKEQTGTE